MAAERREHFDQREATRAGLAIADAAAAVNVVGSIPHVVCGICRFCNKDVTTKDLCGKDNYGYFHVVCDPERTDAVQEALELFNTLKAIPAVPGAVSSGVQANRLFKKLMAAAAVEAAAADTGASAGGLLPPAPFFNGAAVVP